MKEYRHYHDIRGGGRGSEMRQVQQAMRHRGEKKQGLLDVDGQTLARACDETEGLAFGG